MFARHALAFVAVACLVGGSLALQRKPMVAKPKMPPKPTYASIAPIMKNCSMCHQGTHPKHGLDLTTYASLMKGDKEGKVVVAGNPAGSRLSKAVHRKGAAPMPPANPLPTGDVAKIDAWIKAGAKP
jgi:hypothetical protein